MKEKRDPLRYVTLPSATLSHDAIVTKNESDSFRFYMKKWFRASILKRRRFG